MANVCEALVSTPPLLVPPLSCNRTVTVADPFAFNAGVYVSFPVVSTAGNTENSVSLFVLTRKLRDCPDSSVGPAVMLVAHPLTVCAPASSRVCWSTPGVNEGVSLTAVTVRLDVSVVVLNGVVPPLVLTSAVPPFVPAVRSQARNVIAGWIVPLKSAAGTNRIRVRASAESNRALVTDNEPRAFQLVPPLVENCQVPFAASAAVAAIPSSAAESTSVIGSPPALAIRSITRVPVLPVASSRMAASDELPLLSRTGASLTGVTLIVNV